MSPPQAVFAGLLLALIAAAVIYRPTLGLVYTRQGSAALQAAILAEGVDQGEFACLTPAFVSSESRTHLERAIIKLEQSRSIWPAAHTNLLLGRALCSSGQAEKAVDAFAAAAAQRPANPMGQLELALAYSTVCKFNSYPNGAPELCQNPKNRQEVLQAWKNSGLDPDHLLEYAAAAFASGKFVESERYYAYHSYYELENLAPEIADLFRWTVAAVLVDMPLPASAQNALPIFPIKGRTRIEGEHLRWLNGIPEWNVQYGDPPPSVLFRDQTAGLVAWAGAVAAVVDVSAGGSYQITLQALNARPVPILAQVEVNGVRIGEAALNLGDMSWGTHSFATALQPGHNLIGVRFMNDKSDDGLDRNLFINWIEVEYLGE